MRRLFEALDVDYPHWKALTLTALKIDLRASRLGAAQFGHQEVKAAGLLIGQFIFYSAMGVAVALLVWFSRDLFLAATTVVTYVMFMIATTALLDHNAEVVDRARTHVGNLAHALKTPLAVLTNEATGREGPLAESVKAQLAIMQQQVDHHLSRARMAARAGVLGARTSVMPVLEGLARTLEKIYRERGVSIVLDGPPAIAFRGERQDLEEMVGNLVDNACKWAQSRVAVEVSSERPDPKDDRRLVRIVVDDDGPGLSPQQREQVARRGSRLDQTKPGSGLGLSIVVELAALYGGGLTLGTAPIGGLRAELVVPGA